jgi:myosin heavy subunit
MLWYVLQVGHTQVFLKEEGLERLRRAVRDEYHHHASVIQSAARRAATRMLIKRRAAAVLMIQKVPYN